MACAVNSVKDQVRSRLLGCEKTNDAFNSLEALFGPPDSSTLVQGKLIYHLIHCLIYRPFLPVDLTELSGSGQHQSWQIEATNLCFLHANAIAELVEIGKNTSIIDWPSFVGYCICTAGTIHVHGAHYMSLREGDVFSNSTDFLSREAAQLLDLRFVWAGVQHQRETLQMVYTSHSQLVRSLSSNPLRFSPVFQMEDFFDRYPGSYIDGAHVPFSDVEFDPADNSLPFDGNSNQQSEWIRQPTQDLNAAYAPTLPSQYMTQNQMPTATRRAKKRRTTASSMPCPTTPSEPMANATLGRQASPDNWTPSLPPPVPPLEPQPQAHHQQAPQSMDGVDINVDFDIDQVNGQLPKHTFPQSAPSPIFNFSPMQQTLGVEPVENDYWDPFYGAHGFDHRTPSGFSASAESARSDAEKDPFLSMLEQMAQNDASANGGPTELDFLLNGQG